MGMNCKKNKVVLNKRCIGAGEKVDCGTMIWYSAKIIVCFAMICCLLLMI